MKIVVIGGTGTVGQAIARSFPKDYDVIALGRSDGEQRIDITQSESIYNVFEKIGPVDAVIAATGKVAFKPFFKLEDDDWNLGLSNKLMGQIRLTRDVIEYIKPNGSITLTTGIIADYPIHSGTSAATVNGAIEHFVKAVATELPKGIRINAVSPTVVKESLDAYGSYFPGFKAVSSDELALSYVRSVCGVETGAIIKSHAGN